MGARPRGTIGDVASAIATLAGPALALLAGATGLALVFLVDGASGAVTLDHALTDMSVLTRRAAGAAEAGVPKGGARVEATSAARQAGRFLIERSKHRGSGHRRLKSALVVAETSH